MEMKKLVVNGVAYTVADPDAASIDDAKVGDNAWSGKNIVDRMCPGFTKSGSRVTCRPVEGYPLGVVSHIEPVQEGGGDPRLLVLGDRIDTTVTPLDECTCESFVSGVKAHTTYKFTANTSVVPGSIYISDNDGNVITHSSNVTSVEFTTGDSTELYISIGWENEWPADSIDDASYILQEYDPGNIRPITGHSAVKLRRSGKNLMDIYGFSAFDIKNPEYARRLTNDNGTTISATDASDTIEITQTAYGNPSTVNSYENGYVCIGFNHDLKDGEKVTVSFDVMITGNVGNSDVIGIMPSGLANTNIQVTNGRVSHTCNWVNYAERKYLEIRLGGKSMIISNFQIEYGETTTAYEPYRGGEFTLDLGQTVYGGCLNWQTGELTVDRRLDTIDGSADWTALEANANEESALYYCTVSKYKAIYQMNAICNCVPNGAATPVSTTANAFSGNASAPTVLYLRLRYDTGITDVETLKSALNETPLQVCWEIDSITIQLTPQEILALSGENVLISNTGDTEVTGKADLQWVLQRIMEEMENA